MSLTRPLLCVLVSGLAMGCGAAPRFIDAPPIWHVDDERDISEPSKRSFNRKAYYAQIYFSERVDRALSLPDAEPAWNTNSLDDVPSSSWFQNRIGVRALTPAEAARGPVTAAPTPPFAIVGGKAGGGTPGFLLKDALGNKFLVKFDERRNPELHTAAGAIVNRIFWTLGYNVPEDQVFELRRADLSIAADATYENALEQKEPFDEATVDAILRHGPPPQGGTYRALASRLLEGKPKGGFPRTGVREDDPNDTVPHEHRRELRGLRVFAAWVGHTDMKEDNTLDMYVERRGVHFIKHYLVDFDAALNEHAVEMDRPEDGWEYFVDWPAQTKAFLALGLWKRPWEDVKPTPWPAIGSFSAQPFDPRAWHETYPYAPFAEMDDADAYWAAKLAMRVDRPLLEAIVAEGKLSDPAAARYLVDTLVARRDRIGREFLGTVTALDDWQLSASQICATDLAAYHGLFPPARIQWVSDAGVRQLRDETAQGRVCAPLPASEQYVVYHAATHRDGRELPAVELHVMSGPTPRLLGVIRTKD